EGKASAHARRILSLTQAEKQFLDGRIGQIYYLEDRVFFSAHIAAKNAGVIYEYFPREDIITTIAKFRRKYIEYIELA
ncbi:MAG: hypothetical protein LBU58_06240, partial [Clostridiales bacterium]|nr:hypothetical protein [Clostridiales bacterium]